MFTSVVIKRWGQKTRRPYVVTPNGMLEPWALRNSAWKKCLAGLLYERSMLNGAACIQANTEKEAADIRAYGLTNPICIIPNGIDLPLLPKAEILKTESGKQIAEIGKQKVENRNAPWAGMVEPGKKVLLFLSRIHPKKGLPNLLRAWATCHSSPVTRHSGWILAIAGWDQGGHEAELKQLCDERGLRWADVREQKSEIGNQKSEIISAFSFQNFSVLFLGPQFNEAKAACYADCDAFSLPSFSEGLPMAVLEAWAYGKPVLMTPECNLPEGFAANAAIRIEPTAESIAQGLRDLFALDDASRLALGARGRSLVAAKFTWPKIAGEMKSVYDWVLGGGSRPPCVMMD